MDCYIVNSDCFILLCCGSNYPACPLSSLSVCHFCGLICRNVTFQKFCSIIPCHFLTSHYCPRWAKQGGGHTLRVEIAMAQFLVQVCISLPLGSWEKQFFVHHIIFPRERIEGWGHSFRHSFGCKSVSPYH